MDTIISVVFGFTFGYLIGWLFVLSDPSPMSPDLTPPALSEQEIVERLATEVMGWVKGKRIRSSSVWNQDGWWAEDENYDDETYYKFDDDEGCYVVAFDADWNPLTDWNHTMEVVEALREKGLILEMWTTKGNHVCIRDANLKYRNYDIIVTINDQPLQRAICLAALAALPPTPDAR